MSKRRTGTVRVGLVLLAVVVAATAAIVGTQVAQADTNKSKNRLVVYDNNIENMVNLDDCDHPNFNNFKRYLMKQDKSPDLFVIQQISNTAQLKRLTSWMTKELPGVYAGKIAIGDPGSMGYTKRCPKPKNQQTNAIIYRTGRLTPKATTTWRSDAPANPDKGTGGCKNLTPTKTSQDRVVNLGVRFHDKIADASVSVASIHWPTKVWNGPKCAAENMREANAALDRLGGSLKIFAGDANATTGQDDWWKKARGYGFRDPIAEKCGSRVCSDRYNTTAKRRIDHILVKSGHGFSSVENITEKMAGGRYSDHRAVRAYVNY